MEEKKIEYKKCINKNCLNPWLPNTEEFFYGQWFTYAKGRKVYKLNTECKECRKKRSLKWKHDNPEKRKANDRRFDSKPERKEVMRKAAKKQRLEGKQKEWRQNNPDRVSLHNEKRRLHKNHKIKQSEWDACRLYFDYRCAYCGMSYEEHYEIYKQDLHKEHVDDDGANDLSNCIPSCRSCNSQKWEFEFEEWYNKNNPNYSEERYNKITKWLDEDCKKYIIK
ncbi:HNH endonuclease [Paenibacillus naphthalenovorans]|uniref:HNH endonuclease n=1 Tax=Paenibacillus naphthalenovorans TaxID=162209 RepID=A0A0U2M3Z8_9BACL|nr:HNH endonuclease [Paenibacillus naphthalenovorans]ALS22208.1 HNH endonuclease [Paenibacillus naphthalenovorans]